jgi:hypothetical protein
MVIAAQTVLEALKRLHLPERWLITVHPPVDLERVVVYSRCIGKDAVVSNKELALLVLHKVRAVHPAVRVDAVLRLVAHCLRQQRMTVPQVTMEG